MGKRPVSTPVIISPVITPAIIPAVKFAKPVIMVPVVVGTVPVMVLRIVGSTIRSGSLSLLLSPSQILSPEWTLVIRMDSVTRRRGAAGPMG